MALHPHTTTFVSIPHRYARNPDLHHRLNLESRFQFLIGTLETLSKEKGCQSPLTFQFLIGTLETLCCIFTER